MSNSDDLIVDLTGYKDRVGSRVAPGRYRVIVEDTEKDRSSNDNEMVNVWLRIQGGEFDGQTIVDRLVITEKSLFRVVGFMQAIGLPTPRKRLKMNVRGFVGRTLDIDVDDGEPYNGRVKSEVRGYMRIAGGATMTGPSDLDDITPEDEQAAVEEFSGEADKKREAEAKKDEPKKQADEPAEEIDLDSIDLG